MRLLQEPLALSVPTLRLHVAARPSLPRVCSLEAWILSVAAWHLAHEMLPRGQRLALSPSPQGFFLLNSHSGPEEAGSVSFSTCPIHLSVGLRLHLAPELWALHPFPEHTVWEAVLPCLSSGPSRGPGKTAP